VLGLGSWVSNREGGGSFGVAGRVQQRGCGWLSASEIDEGVCVYVCVCMEGPWSPLI